MPGFVDQTVTSNASVFVLSKRGEGTFSSCIRYFRQRVNSLISPMPEISYEEVYFEGYTTYFLQTITLKQDKDYQ